MPLSAARISPTALYTGEVWARHGRSFPELSNPIGAIFYNAMQPAMMSSRWLGGPTLQDFLLARHDLIDAHVASQVEQAGVEHVIEIAAGMSPRGMRFIKTHPSVHYLEADLPSMIAIKRKHLKAHLKSNPRHRVFSVDAFAQDGPHSLNALFDQVPQGKPVVVVTEGLLNYFDRESVEMLLGKLSVLFQSRPGSSYVSDLHLKMRNSGVLAESFKHALGLFVQGRVHLHYADEEDLFNSLEKLDLSAQLLTPSDYADRLQSCAARGADLVNVLIAKRV